MLAKNLEQELSISATEAETRGLPSFLSFDEGSIFAQQANTGAISVSKHYQEAIDVLKRYIGNDIGKWLVLAISTNLLPQDFEEAMTREGRLASFLIDYPSKEQIARMWKHFLGRYNVLSLEDMQAEQLAEISCRESGAFIEEFAKGYFSIVRRDLLKEKGDSSLLGALKKGVNINEGEIRDSINFEEIFNTLKRYLKAKYQRNGSDEKREIGFRSSKLENF